MSTADFSGAQWRKSSRSGDATNCVEVAWRKSSFSSDAGACVEVARGEQLVGVRDSKNTSGPHLVFGAEAWADLLRRA
jgi:hypothetical protein